MRKGHAHASVFADLVRKRVRFATEGTDHSVRETFVAARETHNGHRHAVTQVSLGMSPAYQMRLMLQDIDRSPSEGVARHRFRVWGRWGRWGARKRPKNLLRSMRKVAAMVEKHLAGILAHWKWSLTNAPMEGLNSVFSAAKRTARGDRATTHLVARLYFTAGKLRLPQF